MQFKHEGLQRHIGDLRDFWDIFLIDLLISDLQSTHIAIVDNDPLLRVFDKESYITKRLSGSLSGKIFFFSAFFFLMMDLNLRSLVQCTRTLPLH